MTLLTLSFKCQSAKANDINISSNDVGLMSLKVIMND
jgi:hypothetical protein